MTSLSAHEAAVMFTEGYRAGLNAAIKACLDRELAHAYSGNDKGDLREHEAHACTRALLAMLPKETP
ncbi:MAG: hypothetical protein H0W48_00655 [Methylibium sp.]|nr:hypothetical protein [Methylibium sp.]